MSRFTGVVLAWLACSLGGCDHASAEGGGDPEKLRRIAPFELTDQRGERFGSAQLEGKVWIADMIFTSCPDICPILSTQMSNLGRRLDHDQIHFVSISVDPETDTPERLAEYAERYGADPERWSFLTGARTEVLRLIVGSLLIQVGLPSAEPSDGPPNILHSRRFVLVDQRMQLRGEYETDLPGLRRLEQDARDLLDHSP